MTGMQFLGDDSTLPPTTAQFVAGLLRDLLTQGALEPGSRIKEAEVSDRLGLSRGPVREAFRVLAADGLIKLEPNRGARVSTYSALDVLELYSLRSHLGSLAIHKIIRTEQQGVRERLQPLIDELVMAVAAEDERRVVELDLDFQTALVRASGLTYTVGIFERLSMRLRMFIAVIGTRYDTRLDAIAVEDRTLFDLVLSGNLPGAERAWRERLEGWVKDFISNLPGEEFDSELWVELASGGTPAPASK